MASNAAAAFFRATSPAAISISQALQSPESTPAQREKSLRDARFHLYQGANTLDEVLAVIPSDYRDCLRDPLREVQATTHRMVACRTTCSKWMSLKQGGQVPPQYRVKPVEVQFSKDFAASEQAAARRAAASTAHKAYVDGLFFGDLDAKKLELEHLRSLLQPQHMATCLLGPLKVRGTEIGQRSLRPMFTTNMETGELTLEGMEKDPLADEVFKALCADLAVIALRISTIVESEENAKANKLRRKHDLKAAADVEMGEIPDNSKSVAKMVEEAVAAALKKPSASGSKPPPKVSTHRFDRRVTNNFSSEPQVQEGWQEVLPRQTRQEGEEPERSHQTLDQEDGWQEAGEENSGRQGERQGVVPFRYDQPHTYPDSLLTIPYPAAIKYIIVHTPVSVRLAAAYKNFIHRSPNVSLPKDIEYDLSVGQRFMFRTKRNSKLLLDAWNDFDRRIRWRLLFSFKGEDNSLYDPDYEVDKPNKKAPPKLPIYLEFGLRAGRRFVLDTIANIPPEEDRDQYKSLAPNRNRIQEFLISNKYVVTNTDKNLGVAVSEQTWLEEKCLDLLSDRNNYLEIDTLIRNSILIQQCASMEVIAYKSSKLPGNQLPDFFMSKIPLDYKNKDPAEYELPHFYGIPKIHKLPVKMRPIIPCHSAIQNPAAKYVSKKLKPIVASAPTVLHGTKDLAIKLSKLKLKPGKKFYIVTGDVVAYYPNINLETCLSIVGDMYLKHTVQSDQLPTPDELKQLPKNILQELEVFQLCLITGNKNLITQYKNKTYKQTRGLAMGVADSPDLANLYGWYYESRCGILDNSAVPFYGRFIDDCLAIVYAASEAEAIRHLESVQFKDCVIEWQASDSHQPFLDMTLYRDERGELQHMPFRKAGSHQERIPWHSSHPLDVKRGTFYGEMSRLATLCSTHRSYLEAMEALVALYIVRGYPQAIVTTWLRAKIQERWANRLNESRPAPEGVLVLKSEFNTAWDYFNAKALGDTVLGYWREWTARAVESRFDNGVFQSWDGFLGGLGETDPALCVDVQLSPGVSVAIPDISKLDILNRRLLVARRRTRNLFDLTGLWKKTVIHQMEISALEPIDPNEDAPDDNDDMDIDSDASDQDDWVRSWNRDRGFNV
jgi:hypothetical protein